MNNASGWVLGAWVGAIGLITARQLIGQKDTASLVQRLPEPNAYLGSAVLFTLYWLLSLGLPTLAVVLAVGTDVGLIVQPYLQGKPGLLDQLSGWLQKVSPPPSTT